MSVRSRYPHFQPITTRWKDNDVYGHVNNVEYYSYFDTVINHYLIREGGLDMDGSAWIGLVAPAGVPAPIIARLNTALVDAMKDPATLEKLRAQYMEPEPGTPQQFAAFMQAELKKWGPVIKRSGAKVE